MKRSPKFLFLFALLLAACTEGGDDPGPDAAPPPPAHACKGVAQSCVITSDDACYQQVGCERDLDECTGVSRSCYNYFDSYSCERQNGCYWSFSSNSCSGSSWPCNLNSTESGCTGTDGCSWHEGGCSGEAFRCDQLYSADFCNEQLGCHWE